MDFLVKPHSCTTDDLVNKVNKEIEKNLLILEEVKNVKELYPDAEPGYLNSEYIWKSTLVHSDTDCIVMNLVINKGWTNSSPYIKGILYKVLYFEKFKTKVYSDLEVNMVNALRDIERFEGKASLLEALKHNTKEKLLVGATLTANRDVNLRSSPSAGSSILKIIPSGTIVTLEDPTLDDGFYKLKYENMVGWSYTSFNF